VTGAPSVRSPRWLALALVAGVLLTVVSAPSAGADPAPWLVNNSVWVGYQLAPATPTYDAGQSAYGPITLTRDAASTAALADFVTESHDFGSGPAPAWPTSVSLGGGLTLSRGSLPFCPITASQCQYYLSGSPGPQQLKLYAGTPPGGADPAVFFAPYTYTPTLPSPPPVQPTPPSHLTVTYDRNTHMVSFDASTTVDPSNVITDYQWTLTGPGGAQTFHCGTSSTCTQSATLQDGANYDVTLALIGATGTPSASSTLAVPNAPGSGGGGGAPGGGGDPSGGGGGTGGGGSATNRVVFAQPVSAGVVASGGFPAPVVWLWKPEWYTPDGKKKAPETGGASELKGSSDLVVEHSDSGSGSAGWLVGLGVFGVVGMGYLLRRRHHLHLEP